MNKIFDSAFRTMVEKTPELIVMLINEFFHTDYAPDEAVIQPRNEHFSVKGEIITDSVFIIRGKVYHIEVQSSDDESMAIRMVEYDFMISLERAEKVNGIYRMKFPESCVLYIKRTVINEDVLNVSIGFPDGQEVLYKVPAIPTLSYDLKTIFAKRLYALLPYYILRYEKKNIVEREREQLIQEYEYIVSELEKLLETQSDSGYIVVILELSQMIIDEVLKGQPETKKEVEELMGGKILELASDKKYKQGLTKGMSLLASALKEYKEGSSIDEIEKKYGKDVADLVKVCR